MQKVWVCLCMGQIQGVGGGGGGARGVSETLDK